MHLRKLDLSFPSSPIQQNLYENVRNLANLDATETVTELVEPRKLDFDGDEW